MGALPFTPSPHQAAFFEWIKLEDGSCVLVAVAGSGKSTTIRRSLLQIPEGRSVLMLSFNFDITAENKAKVAELGNEFGREFRNVSIKTFHGLGYGAVRKFLSARCPNPEVDSRKCEKLVRAWLGEAEQELYSSFICKLAGLAKGEGIGALVADVDQRWYDLIAHHDLFLESEEADEVVAVRLARELLRRSNEAAKGGSLDFDDQIYLPILWKLRLWQHDWVFVDEAQDTNPVRRALAKLALRPGGRLVAVGDPCQAIYGFTGASHDAIELIKREFHAIELPLTVSYRCAKAVVARAQRNVSHIQAHPGAPEGKFEYLSLEDALKVLDHHDAICCRQTAPLIGLAFKLIAQNRGCTVLGKEIGAGLVNLVKKQKAAGIDRLIEKLSQYEEREVAKHTARGEEQKAEGVSDRVACIMTVIDHLAENERSVPKLITKIEGMFTDKNGVLTLSTIHKLKGKEFERVAIYRPDLMPSKWARQDHQFRQELNLQYVADTRAKTHLIEILNEEG